LVGQIEEVGRLPERVLVNFFYAHPVGHAVEALHYCLGHHAAGPEREISVALNAASAVRLADFCPFVAARHAIEHPLLEPCEDSMERLGGLPRRWDWVLDDPRRFQDFQLETFPGLRDYYAASDRHLLAGRGRTVVGADPPGYVPHQQLRFSPPRAAREAAARRLAASEGNPGPARWIAVMPAGSSERALYPSLHSWQLILHALGDAFPAVRIALLGKLRRDRRTATSIDRVELDELLTHATRPLDCFDIDLADQLAIVEACDIFLAPHTGFGLAALAVGTPWLAISGGRWFEYYFNHVPFRSIIPDVERYPSFSQFAPAAMVDDGEDGPRTPSMSRSRVRDDLDAIIAATGELLDGSLTYEQALRDYFTVLLAAHQGDPSPIWSIDGVHRDYLPEETPHGSPHRRR
jgi:hypothetical protein